MIAGGYSCFDVEIVTMKIDNGAWGFGSWEVKRGCSWLIDILSVSISGWYSSQWKGCDRCM